MKKYLFLLLTVAFIMSCEDSSNQYTAQLMQLDNLVKTPGYSWFDVEYKAYEPNQQMLDEIKNNFDPQIHKFLVFLKPACSCPGTHKLFPAFVKGSDLSGIPDANIEYYSMRSNGDAYPYSDLFTLNELPAFIILKNGQPIYSVTDTMLTRTTLEYELNPDFPVELFIEDALKNY